MSFRYSLRELSVKKYWDEQVFPTLHPTSSETRCFLFHKRKWKKYFLFRSEKIILNCFFFFVCESLSMYPTWINFPDTLRYSQIWLAKQYERNWNVLHPNSMECSLPNFCVCIREREDSLPKKKQINCRYPSVRLSSS